MDLGTLSIFPTLLDYDFLAAGVLRVALGLLLVSLGSRFFARTRSKESDTSTLGIAASIVGLALTIGFYTQIAAILAGVIWSIVAFHAPRKAETPVSMPVLYGFLALASLLLLFFGPGPFAVDLPF